MSGASNEPRNLVERAAGAALDAMRAELATVDAKLERAFVLLVADGVPAGELDACTAGHGVEDARELIALVATHLVQAGREVGIQIDLVPIAGRNQG